MGPWATKTQMPSKTGSNDDRHYMRIALSLARRGLGNVWPNPAVGCVVVRDGAVVGRGWTQPGGRPHAETEALQRARDRAAGSTAYVSLEPCAHHGQTPPCAEALIAARVRRVVVALRDPDPRVNGGGIERLRSAGIEVTTDILPDEATMVNAGFLCRVQRGRPLVALKLATTLDGRIATRSGQSQWITGEAARNAAHAMRARFDAILVGAGTAIADDPRLTCRLPGLAARSPLRVVVEGNRTLPTSHHLISHARELPTLAIVPEGEAARRRAAYESAGVVVAGVPADANGRPDLEKVVSLLAERGITRLMVEGGAEIAAALLRADLVDRLIWFRAPAIIGGDGLSAAAGLGVDKLDEASHFTLMSARPVGADMLETYERVR